MFAIGGAEHAGELDAKRAIDQGVRLAAKIEDAAPGSACTACRSGWQAGALEWPGEERHRGRSEPVNLAIYLWPRAQLNFRDAGSRGCARIGVEKAQNPNAERASGRDRLSKADLAPGGALKGAPAKNWDSSARSTRLPPYAITAAAAGRTFELCV